MYLIAAPFIAAIVALYVAAKVSTLWIDPADREAIVVLRQRRAVRAVRDRRCWLVPFIETFDIVFMDPSVRTLSVSGFTADGVSVHVQLGVTISCVDAAAMYRQRPTLEDQAERWVCTEARLVLATFLHDEVAVDHGDVAHAMRARCRDRLAPLGLDISDFGIAAVRSASDALRTLDRAAVAIGRYDEALFDARTRAEAGRIRAAGHRDELEILDDAVQHSHPATHDLVRTRMVTDAGTPTVFVHQASGVTTTPPAPPAPRVANGHGFALVIDTIVSRAS